MNAAAEFLQALVDETPRFDEKIIEDIRPWDVMACHSHVDPLQETMAEVSERVFYECREAVRRLSEGPGYKMSPWKTRPWSALELMVEPVEITHDRFRAIFPNTTEVWRRK